MNRKWSWFAGAALFAAFILITKGAPPLPVAAGIGCAALLVRRNSWSV
jgi:hypothetical protein